MRLCATRGGNGDGMSDTTQIARTNGTGTRMRDQADRDRRDRRALADTVRLKTRLLTLNSLDKRTLAYRRTAELISQLETDAGSDPSVAQKLLIQRAALTAAMIEHEETKWLSGGVVDPTVHATLTNSLRRLLESIAPGLQRVPRNIPTLAEHLARLASEPPSHDDDDQEDEDQADSQEGQEEVSDPLRIEDKRSDEDVEAAA